MSLAKPRITILHALQKASERLHGSLHFIYLFFAIPATVLTALITPPFQVPDEPNHFCRAEQISRGILVTSFHTLAEKKPIPGLDKRILLPDIGGFNVDKGIGQANYFFRDIPFRTASKVNGSMFDSSRKINWGRGIEYANFPNTAIYPPTGYMASTIGIWIGKLINASVVDTLYISRCLNGLFCILLCFYSLRLAKSARLVLFTILLFPMTLAIFGSVSQDATLIALACVFFAIVSNVESSEEKRYSSKQLLIMAVAIASISAARPPYFMLSLVIFFLSMDRRKKFALFFASLVPVLLWGLLNRNNYAVVWAPPAMRINAGLQLQHIIDHPLQFIALFFKYNFIAIREAVYECIGVLGWKDLTLPSYFYRAAFLTFICAVILTTYFKARERANLRLAILFASVAAFVAIMTAQYITWMPLEAPYLGGVQGRYFIPILIPLFFALAGFRNQFSMKPWQAPIFLYVLLFPIFSIVVLTFQLIGRYHTG